MFWAEEIIVYQIGDNKNDKHKYIFEGGLGCVFKSYEFFKPDIGEERYIYDVLFRPCRAIRKGLKYEIWWVSPYLRDYEQIAQFYYDNLLRQIPNGTKIDCFKNCLKEFFKLKGEKDKNGK